MIAAILRAQWQSQRAFGVSAKRPATWFSVLIGLVFYGFWAVTAYGAEEFFANLKDESVFRMALPSVLLGIILYWQIAPVVTASLGASLDLRKLLVYPVLPERLLMVEILLRLTTVAEMLLVTVGVAVGVCRSVIFGGPAAIPRVVPATIALILMNLFVSSGLRSVIERLLRKRKMRQLLFVFLMLVGVGPQILIATNFSAERFAQYLPVASYWPWGALAHFMLGSQMAGSAALIAGFSVLAFRFGRWQFLKSLREGGEVTSRASTRPERRENNRSLDSLFRLPTHLLRDPLGALVEKEIRSMARNPRFRMVFVMGFSFGLLVWLPRVMGSGRDNVVTDHFLTFVTVYALIMFGQVSYWNCFAFDRSAAQLYFSVPISFRSVLVSKNLSVAFFALAEIVMITVMTALFRIALDPRRISEAVSVTMVSAVYLFSIGNITSVRFPRPLNAEKMTQGSSARTANAAMFLLFPFALLPVVLAYWARSIFESDLIFFGILLLALAIGAAVYWVSLDSAAETAQEQRERILAELSKGQGPLSSE